MENGALSMRMPLCFFAVHCALSFSVLGCELAVVAKTIAVIPSVSKPDCYFSQDKNANLRPVRQYVEPLTPNYPDAAIPLNFDKVQSACKLKSDTIHCQFADRQGALPLASQYQRGRLSYDQWRVDNHYFIGWTSHDPERPAGFMVLSTTKPAYWLPVEDACKARLSTRVVTLNSKENLCLNHQGIWQRSNTQSLPAPCENPYSVATDKNGVWALQLNNENQSWNICHFDHALQLVKAYQYQLDIPQSLAPYKLVPTSFSQVTALFGEYDNAPAYAFDISAVEPMILSAFPSSIRRIQIPLTRAKYRLSE
ncbi:hypothetical protein KIJ96_04015 [Pseudoalteromonas piscicida]|nr:hypothetical protein KIJ96_04015 [Pseudoalteromonas piscicida]